MMSVMQSAAEFGGSIVGGNVFSTLFFWGMVFVLFLAMVAGSLLVAALVWRRFQSKGLSKAASQVGDLAADALSSLGTLIPGTTPKTSPSEDAIAYKLSMLDATDTLPGDVARKVMRESSTDIDALRATVKLQAAALSAKGSQVTV